MPDTKLQSLLETILATTGWTAATLAHQLQISTVTLSQWRAGKTAPRRQSVAAVAHLYQRLFAAQKLPETETLAIEQQKMSAKEILSSQYISDTLIILFTHYSLRLAGHDLRLTHTRQLLHTNSAARDLPLSEQILVKNHATAMIFLLGELRAQGDDFRWHQPLLRDTHLRLFNSLSHDAGWLRQRSARLTDWHQVPDQLDKIIAALNDTSAEPLAALARTHAAIVKLQPFATGNDLLARLILLGHALQRQMLPPIFTDLHAKTYRAALAQATSSGGHDALASAIRAGMGFASVVLTE